MKKLRTCLAALMAWCMMFTALAAFAAPVQRDAIQSVYYADGTIGISQEGRTCKILVRTEAYQNCHVYHDITIYKNGTWVSSDRYENWNADSLRTTLTVSVSSGDRIEVYVDHYAENEGDHNSRVYYAS